MHILEMIRLENNTPLRHNQILLYPSFPGWINITVACCEAPADVKTTVKSTILSLGQVLTTIFIGYK